jgi:hypothetical protein
LLVVVVPQESPYLESILVLVGLVAFLKLRLISAQIRR